MSRITDSVKLKAFAEAYSFMAVLLLSPET
jgi:hypothetical protein